MLTAEHIHKSYGGREILHGVSLNVAPGEITAILGPSGGGKSTLLRTLSLLDPPETGTVTLDEEKYSFPSLARNGAKPPWPKLTVVFQQLFLWPHLTLRQNITLPLEKERGRSDAKRVTVSGEIDELLKFFELAELADRYPNEASLGQRQRVAFVRALVLKPKYLLLDEITSALDVEHVSKILEYLKTLKQQGTGILLVTHLIGFAKSAADQVVFMEGGRIIDRGDHSLLTTPRNERVLKFLSLVETAL